MVQIFSELLKSGLNKMNFMVVVEEWADQVGGGGGGWRSPCIMIGYSEPTRAESRESRAEKGPPPEPRALGWRNTRFRFAEDSGNEILEFDWLPSDSILDSD